ncbi:hypothetical protein BDW59DRAFT_174586 [Aspergillus cavernicola]|uniref:Uncharacterized protein n=1 Tax=Aspergillus cavernicola TaxID=176166 RepID=A0ABR4HXN0_9EURO
MSPCQNSRRPSKRQTPPVQKPPAYWDNLSRVWLTRGALRELQRRIGRPQGQTSQRPFQSTAALLKHYSPDRLQEITRLSRRGGLDLSDLRGYPPPGRDGIMAPPIQPDVGSKQMEEETSTTPTTPYSHNFQQNLTDHQVYPPMYRYLETEMCNEPENMGEIRERLTARRPSLSPSNFGNTEYKRFAGAYWNTSKEAGVLDSVVPWIQGTTSQYAGRNSLFNNLAPLTDGSLSQAKPDIYYGARPEQLNREIRHDLSNKIIPSKDDSLPMAPNFFMEVKGNSGNQEVATRQACYYGALGAQGMHALNSYEPDKTQTQSQPVYDNNANTITSTYGKGMLALYTSHLTKPTSPEGRPECHMTHLQSIAVHNGPENFREGAAAYRNARDWAKEKRDESIVAANGRLAAARARQAASRCGNELLSNLSIEEEEEGEGEEL